MKPFGSLWHCCSQHVSRFTIILSLILFTGISAYALHDLDLLDLDGDATTESMGPDWDMLPPHGGGIGSALKTLFVGSGFEHPDVDVTYFTGGGSKDILDISSWKHTDGSAPDKDEILDAFAAAFINDTQTGSGHMVGDLMLYFGLDRYAVNGDSQVGFWFNQDAINTLPDGTFDGVHQVGDILILSDFVNGGSISEIDVFIWVGIGGGGDSDGDGAADGNGALQIVASGVDCNQDHGLVSEFVCATVINGGDDKVAPWPYDSKGNKTPAGEFPVGSLYEGGVNITRLLIGLQSDPDINIPALDNIDVNQLCYSSFIAETRSSQSPTAVLKDFALGEFKLCSTITVEKVTIPSDSTEFKFSVDGGSLAGAVTEPPLADGESFTVEKLQPGAYNADETDANSSGYALTDISCSSSLGAADVTVNSTDVDIQLRPSEDATCTFTNTKMGKVIIKKVTQGQAQLDPFGSFNYTSDVDGNFSLTTTAAGEGGSDDITFNDVMPGQYTVVETGIPLGFGLESLSCNDSDAGGTASSTNLQTATATINVDPGETVECTYTNLREAAPGIVKIRKLSIGGAGQFNYTGELGPFPLTTVSAGTMPANVADLTDPANPLNLVEKTFPGALQDIYDVTETVPAGWDLTSLTCNDPNNPIADTTVNLNTATASISVDDGETVICTYVNVKRGRIKVDKVTQPASDLQLFTFNPSYGNSFQLADASPMNDSGLLVPGSYSVSETVPSGWELTNTVCNSSLGGTEPAGNITLDPGEVVTCTFTNTKDGKIIVKKLTQGGDASFGFTGEINTSLSHNQTSMKAVKPGQYQISETPMAGWMLTNLSCNDGNSGGAGSTATYNVEPGETVTCTFTNTKSGKIIVEKLTVGGNASFGFTGEINTSLSHAQTSMKIVVPGQYQISETAKAGWDLTDISCTDGNSGGAGSTATYNVEAGEEVKCTFTNTKRGEIIVEKLTVGGDASFGFTGEINTSLSHAQTDNKVVIPGQYQISETAKSGWDLTKLSCNDSNSSGNGATATYNVEPGETVKCTFTNTKRGAVTIVKRTEGQVQLDPFGTFGYTTDIVDGQVVNGEFSLTTTAAGVGGQDSVTFSNMLPGSYSVDETGSPLVFALDSVSCVDSVTSNSSGSDVTGISSIVLDPGELVTCTYVNVREAAPGNIIIRKLPIGDTMQFNYSGDLGPFSLTPAAAGSLPANLADLTDIANPLGLTQTTFPGVEQGFVNVIETVPGAWDLTHLVCNDPNNPIGETTVNLATATANISIDDGETVVCAYVNVKRAMAMVTKTVSGQAPITTDPEFSFEIRVGADASSQGNAVATAVANDASWQDVMFNCTAYGIAQNLCRDVDEGSGAFAKLLPGAYQFCEINMMPGWSNIQVDPGTGVPLEPQTWFVPEGGDPEADNAVECLNITLDPGETEDIAIDDVPPPGGDPRTIGFWKNWTSCDGRGNQYEKWLDDPDNFTILDANLPVTLWSGFTIEQGQCPVGVDLLDKRDIGNPAVVRDAKKRANDAAYALASQYTASLLNVNAGAITCAALLSAQADADALLDTISFNGSGSYLPPQKRKSDFFSGMSNATYKAWRSEAQSLAGSLDTYNNGNLPGCVVAP